MTTENAIAAKVVMELMKQQAVVFVHLTSATIVPITIKVAGVVLMDMEFLTILVFPVLIKSHVNHVPKIIINVRYVILGMAQILPGFA